ncbi:hypothetical protein [Mucilaginibacter gotjawali]|uniref:Uncharacterized protein n=1 Tax=Mucilaginibacter gotjawali TaxID=1550579 RepID=A0A839SEN2_9SPHI|nr:hypothetical protein [Mucilaginibacter gotjawali]MBB3056755.1 hypothetical protein [Mucilaginibacter gotjawali]
MIVIQLLYSCHGNKPTNVVRKTVNSNSCINSIKNYSDTVKFEKDINLYDKLKYEKKFSLENCNTDQFRDDPVFQKSVIKIVLKIYLYCISLEEPRDDLFIFYRATNTTIKTIDEYIYIMNGKKVPLYPVENLEVNTVRSVIKENKIFQKDKDIMSLLDSCNVQLKKIKHIQRR